MDHENSVPLQIEPDVRNLLEQRGIREEDVRRTLSVTDKEQLFHTNKATGHRLAYVITPKVTYWVEYALEEGIYRIFNAYSHRMKILEGFNLPPKKESQETDWSCARCLVPLALATVKLAYLDETFAVELPSCPTCQRVLISEENAVVKMAMAERMLEDK